MENVINIYRGTNRVWTDVRILNELNYVIRDHKELILSGEVETEDVVMSFVDFMVDEEKISGNIIKEVIREAVKTNSITRYEYQENYNSY